MQGYIPENAFKLSHEQIMNIVNKLVPLIASKEDEAYFSQALYIRLAETNSSEAATFVKKLLDAKEAIDASKNAECLQ